MIIKELYIKSNFKYIWLKSVEGVNLNVHCAKCLIGEYNNEVNNSKKEFKNIILDDKKIYYLCGVSSPYNWNKNFHLAFMYKENSIINITENGISVIINNAERIEINSNYINHSKSVYKEFATCRNWQFANFLQNTNFFKN